MKKCESDANGREIADARPGPAKYQLPGPFHDFIAISEGVIKTQSSSIADSQEFAHRLSCSVRRPTRVVDVWFLTQSLIKMTLC